MINMINCNKYKLRALERAKYHLHFEYEWGQVPLVI